MGLGVRGWRGLWWGVLGLGVGAWVACGGAGHGGVELRMREVLDAAAGGLASHRVLVPEGWAIEGGAWWAPPHLPAVPPSQSLRVSGPRGWSVEVGPMRLARDYEPSAFAKIQLGARRAAEGAVEDGLPVEYLPRDPDGWEAWIREKEFLRRRPDANGLVVEGIVIVPDLTEALGHRLVPLRTQAELRTRQALAEGGKQESFLEGAVLGATLRYREAQQDWEELLLFGATYGGYATEMGRQVEWVVDPCLAFRAPMGELDGALPLLLSIATSVRPTAGWLTHVARRAPKPDPLAALGAEGGARLLVEGRRALEHHPDEEAPALADSGRADPGRRTLARIERALRATVPLHVVELDAEVLLPRDRARATAGGLSSH